MGFSIKEITYKSKYLLYLAQQELSGPWFSFQITGKNFKPIPVVLKNIEPTPIYKLINSRKGVAIDRITLDFDINEYLKKLVQENKISMEVEEKNSRIRLYIDVFLKPRVPYMNTFFTLKNNSDYDLIDFSMYFVFDFDINGLEGFDNDIGGYDFENDIIYQYDNSGVYAAFSPLSKPTYYQVCETKDLVINYKNLFLKNVIQETPGEIASALQIEFKTLSPDHSFQTALVVSGGLNYEEMRQNIIDGKKNAMKFLNQVNRSVRSEQRNTQEKAFIKLNEREGKGCS